MYLNVMQNFLAITSSSHTPITEGKPHVLAYIHIGAGMIDLRTGSLAHRVLSIVSKGWVSHMAMCIYSEIER